MSMAISSMALSSSLRALARPILPFDSFSARLWLSGVAAPAVHARRRPRRRGAGVVVLAAALPSDAEWLPEKKKPLYTHSLPCIEDRAVWVAEMPLWHARLSLDVADLHIRYMKSSPGNLEKDVDRRFSYAVSREDIENTILGTWEDLNPVTALKIWSL